MIKKSVLIATCLIFLAGGITTYAAPIQWSVADGGNGHWYEAVWVSGHITWTDSKVAAENIDGYLATVTSEAENSFVFSLVKDRPELWQDMNPWVAGPWLGGYQDKNDLSYSEPLGAWKWVSGETWSFASWMSGTPNIGGGQDYLHFCGYGSISPTWDDVGNEWYASGDHGYIVEWNTNPVPEPSSIVAILTGLAGISGMAIGKRK